MPPAEKKTLRLEKVPHSALVKFAWNGGGELPPVLMGSFTSPAAAKMALTMYNAGQKETTVLVEHEDAPRRNK